MISSVVKVEMLTLRSSSGGCRQVSEAETSASIREMWSLGINLELDSISLGGFIQLRVSGCRGAQENMKACFDRNVIHRETFI